MQGSFLQARCEQPIMTTDWGLPLIIALLLLGLLYGFLYLPAITQRALLEQALTNQSANGSSFIRVLQHVQPHGIKQKDAVPEERANRLYDGPTLLSIRDPSDPPSPFQRQMEREDLFPIRHCCFYTTWSANKAPEIKELSARGFNLLKRDRWGTQARHSTYFLSLPVV
ncbi:hypothetical protein Q8A67_000843 [Cirrhinus molitorella]|uniref:Uncharacterized protein n=1 Tax=Cirrhinus molitorella TaxID=172907 RepID=A0AA88QK56_9TELE|nr:hypothetical protein Q8A67_000843 [Cirrhinus molitorella]